MRTYNNELTFSNTALTADRTTDAHSLEHYSAYAIFLSVTGGTAPTGTFQVQGSNDEVSSPALVTNWAAVTEADDVTPVEVDITDNGNVLINVAVAGYRWVRVLYDFTSGTGTVSGRINCKG